MNKQTSLGYSLWHGLLSYNSSRRADIFPRSIVGILIKKPFSLKRRKIKVLTSTLNKSQSQRKIRNAKRKVMVHLFSIK